MKKYEQPTNRQEKMSLFLGGSNFSKLNLYGVSLKTSRYIFAHILFSLGFLLAVPPVLSAQQLFDIATSRPEQFKALGRGSYKIVRDKIILDIPADPHLKWPGLVLEPPSGQYFDLSAYSVLAVDVRNLNAEPAQLEAEIANEENSKIIHRMYGGIGLGPGESATLRIRYARAGNRDAKWGPAGLRNTFDGFEHGSWHAMDNRVVVDKVNHLGFFLLGGNHTGKFELSNIRLEEPATPLPPALTSPETFYPCVDRFGQYKHGEWPGKLHDEHDFTTALAHENADLAAHPDIADRTPYGGWKSGPSFKATGHFYPVKYQQKWFLVDPTGKLFWSLGLNSIELGMAGTGVTLREHYFEKLPPRVPGVYRQRSAVQHWYKKAGLRSFDTVNFLLANCMLKYGVSDEAAVVDMLRDRMKKRLRSWGFNTIGNWSDSRLIPYLRQPYVLPLGYGMPLIQGDDGYWQSFYDAFSPEFETRLTLGLKSNIRALQDPFCIGFFVGNEVTWGDKTSLACGVLRSPATQSAKIAFADILRQRYDTPERLNAEWGSSYASWHDFLESTQLPDLKRAESDLAEFNRKLIDSFFRKCKKVLAEHAPDKLFLGCRMYDSDRKEVIQIAAQYVDVLSFNLYRYSIADFRLPQGVDKPVLIGEWHFGTFHYGPPCPGICPVASQAERARSFERYVQSALWNPAIVGAHYFACYDQPATGRWNDNENIQQGFLDIADTPYQEIIDAARRSAAQLYDYRLRSPTQRRLYNK